MSVRVRTLSILATVAACLVTTARADETLRTPGGEIEVTVPEGPGWTCKTEHANPSETVVRDTIRCRRLEPWFITLEATSHEGSPLSSIEEICRVNVREAFRPAYPEMSYVDTVLLHEKGGTTCRIVIEGLRSPKDPARDVTWYTAAPSHVYSVSVVYLPGTPGADAIGQAWRAGVRFCEVKPP